MSDHPSVEVSCFLAADPKQTADYSLTAELLDGDKVLGKATQKVEPQTASRRHGRRSLQRGPCLYVVETREDPARNTLTLTDFGKVSLWDLDTPRLYTVRVRLLRDGALVDEDARRIGFRHAEFTDHGFTLNGKVIKLRGLDRHQTFPFVGQAMPARAQRQDADVLRKSCTATSCGPRTIRSRGTFSIAATRSGCWCWKRFRAGSTLGTRHGSRLRSTMWAA